MEPRSGDNKAANLKASSSCFLSSKRWKNRATYITDTRPARERHDVKEWKLGQGVSGGLVNICPAGRKAGSRTSPTRQVAAKVSGVDLYSSCPKSQNAKQKHYRIFC